MTTRDFCGICSLEGWCGFMSKTISDSKPESGGEFFNSKGISLDYGKCFMCNLPKQTIGLLSSLTAVVRNIEAGERVVEMVKLTSISGCYLDRENCQIRICTCDKHTHNLVTLESLLTDGIITVDKIIKARRAH